VKVGPGGVSPEPPPAPPSGDPTVGLPDVEWRVQITDYRLQDGLNWPRKFTTSVDGKPHQDMWLGTYRINPKIDPRTFAPRG
jgi:hypothetical protein